MSKRQKERKKTRKKAKAQIDKARARVKVLRAELAPGTREASEIPSAVPTAASDSFADRPLSTEDAALLAPFVLAAWQATGHKH
jgi:hypothetical protein